MLFGLIKSRHQKAINTQGEAIFCQALAQAKTMFPQLFSTNEPATQDPLRTQRFEAISLCMSVMLRQLPYRQNTQQARAVAQAAHDCMFLSFDRSLREGGVGDIGVSHKIKKYAQAFYGRLDRYTKALEARRCDDLTQGLVKNMQLDKIEAENVAQKIMHWADRLQPEQSPPQQAKKTERRKHAS